MFIPSNQGFHSFQCIEVRDLEMSESGNLSLSADHFKEDNLQMFPLYLLIL